MIQEAKNIINDMFPAEKNEAEIPARAILTVNHKRTIPHSELVDTKRNIKEINTKLQKLDSNISRTLTQFEQNLHNTILEFVEPEPQRQQKDCSQHGPWEKRPKVERNCGVIANPIENRGPSTVEP